MDNSRFEDSPYRDEDTHNSSQASTSAQASFEAEAAKIRARMPYRPPSPSNAPLSESSFHRTANGVPSPSHFGFPGFVRDAPTARAPNQMSREGPVPRAPGATRDPDFYETLTPRNQTLLKLYGAATIFSVITLASVVYTAWNIHFANVFSEKAKSVMLSAYGWSGYGGLLLGLIPALAFSLHSLSNILAQSTPLLEIYSAIVSSLSSVLVTLFTVLTLFKLRNQGQDQGQSGKWDACLAPGADKWKRLPCTATKDKMWGVQMLGLGFGCVAAILFFVLALVHLTEAKSGGGSLFARQKGYVRLEQSSLNPYEVHDADEFEDEEPRGQFKP